MKSIPIDDHSNRPNFIDTSQNSSSDDSNVFTDSACSYSISLFTSPFKTINYAFCVLLIRLLSFCKIIFGYKKIISIAVLLLSIFIGFYFYNGPHQIHLKNILSSTRVGIYWLGLGVLSSVGLGTGLHTFVLYLGPHIGLVTLAAWDCQTVDFLEPPYPNEIICPNIRDIINDRKMSLFLIFSKIHFESLMWGFGTALGELPPYFMARTARLTSNETTFVNNDTLDEFNSLMATDESSSTDLVNFQVKAKKFLIKCVQNAGFWGILLFASIPNPLFDLAGIACGHCLISFKKFFFATLIGKSLIKTTLQVFTVILAFSPQYLEKLFILLRSVPRIGTFLVNMIENLMHFQHEKFHKNASKQNSTSSKSIPINWFSWIFEKVILVMVAYFIISIINAMANAYIRRYQIVANKSLHIDSPKKTKLDKSPHKEKLR